MAPIYQVNRTKYKVLRKEKEKSALPYDAPFTENITYKLQHVGHIKWAR